MRIDKDDPNKARSPGFASLAKADASKQTPTVRFAQDARERIESRRRFLLSAAAGSAILAFGGYYMLTDNSLPNAARAQVRPDGRPRLPPGQRVIERLRAMGGQEGDLMPRNFTLSISGAVDWTLSWTAGGLVFLAVSGLFMLKGRQGVLGWRGL